MDSHGKEKILDEREKHEIYRIQGNDKDRTIFSEFEVRPRIYVAASSDPADGRDLDWR